jgi:lipopolysaccharide/colanic/teichoic acid biosynthesis glycosyltransferase
VTRGEIAFAIISGLLVNEATDVCPWLALRLVRWAARLRYPHAPERAAIRAVEHAAVINDRPGKLFKLFTALGFALHALLVLRRSRKPVGMTGWRTAAKRTIDVGLAAMFLTVVLPLWAVIAAAILLTSSGPVFSHELRLTKGGRVFRLHRFRTTRGDATRPLGLDEDSQLTRVGAFLRRCGFDAMPLIWSILIGDMSFVGPLAVPADMTPRNVELLRPRLAVRAGLVDLWSVKGSRLVLTNAEGGLVVVEDPLTLNLFYANYYVKNWSLALDLYILIKLFVEPFRQRGAS